jgi:hypothetical protein
MALKTKYSPLQHFSLGNLLTAFGELTPVRKLLALGAVAALLVLLLFLPLSLLSGKVASLKQDIASSQKGYLQVADKIAEYQRAKTASDSLENRFGKAAGSLTTRIESVAKQSGLTVDQVKEKAPTETDYLEINSLEVKLSNVGLKDLLDLLYNLENDRSSPLRIRRIQIKPSFKNRQILDVSFEVATFSVKKEI